LATRRPFNKYGMVNGHVEYVSPDAADLPDTRKRDRKDTREHVISPSGFRTLVELDSPNFEPNGKQTVPGLGRDARVCRSQSRQPYVDGILAFPGTEGQARSGKEGVSNEFASGTGGDRACAHPTPIVRAEDASDSQSIIALANHYGHRSAVSRASARI
jgi:hypothetical protein